MRYITIFSLFLALCTGCLNDDDSVDQSAVDNQIIQKYLTDNQLEADSVLYGVYAIIDEEGTGGSPDLDSIVTIKYTGKLIDGTVFDESEEDDSLSIMLSNLIPGLQAGIPLLEKGGNGTFVIPSLMGYRDYVLPSIPANSVLVFDIELLDFHTIEDYDDQVIQDYMVENDLEADFIEDGVYGIITEEGAGDSPTVSSDVTVKYKGYLTDGTVFDETKGDETRTFPLGGLIEGWKIAIPKLKKGGKGTFLIPSYLGYGKQSSSNIPSNSVLVFEIELVDFE